MDHDEKSDLIQNNEEKIEFDQILNTIGLGIFQYRIFFALLVLSMTEAAQLQIYTLTTNMIQIEFEFSQEHQDIMSALVILATVLGNFFSGSIASIIGRSNSCIYGGYALFFFQTLISVAYDFQSLILLRFVTSYLIGFFSPIAITILTEIIPQYIRGRFIVFLCLGFIIGQSFGILISTIYLDKDMKHGDWRTLNFISALPIFVSCIASSLYLYESPRYLLINQKFDRAIEIIELMEKTNANNSQSITEQDKNNLVKWAKKQKKKKQKSFITFLEDKKNLYLTILVWITWITSTFVYYGIILFLPHILKQVRNPNFEFTIKQLLYIQAFEFFGQSITFFMIDKAIFGRKNSMIALYLIAAIISFLAYFQQKYILFFSTILKTLVINIQVFCFQYTSEVYPTKIRTQGVGVASAVSKFVAIFMPLICGYLERYQTGRSFQLYALLNLLSVYFCYILPYDTTNRPLDQDDNEQDSFIKESN